MGFIRAGFTGGFLGIVVSILDIFVNSKTLERLSSVGLYLANFFGKACISDCGLAERLITIIATIVGNCIAYFVIFALISLLINILVMWFKPSKDVGQVQTPVQVPQIIVQQPPQIQTPVAVPQQPTVPIETEMKIEKPALKETRPKKRARVRKKK
ncbi:MAG: hypothetical protein AABW89_03150 [Nanoarchaeota archaeon]